MPRTTSGTFWHYVRSALIVTITGGALAVCSGVTSPDKSGTFFGPVTTMGNGTARSYVTLDRSGVPTELGVAFTDAALTGLPSATAEFQLELPTQASATPFKHATVDWQAAGHPPPMVYTVPHFDFHFYMITPAERAGIVLGDSALTAKMVRQPAAEFVPAGYVAGMATARMGMHWNDPTAPERNGQPFTSTFIYGSYDGSFIFGEPMVALSYLQTKPVAIITPIKLPAQYAARGYQPVSYSVGYDTRANEYRVALLGLVAR